MAEGVESGLTRTPSADEDSLRTECEVFTRYLIDEPPSAHVVASYVRAHSVADLAPPDGVLALDHAAMRWARRGGLSLRLADVNARFFRKGGYLRRKLVLLLALIETDTAGRRRADRPSAAGPVALFFRMAVWGVVAGTLLVVSVPVMWFSARRTRPALRQTTS